jgi:hypothetical protein
MLRNGARQTLASAGVGEVPNPVVQRNRVIGQGVERENHGRAGVIRELRSRFVFWNNGNITKDATQLLKKRVDEFVFAAQKNRTHAVLKASDVTSFGNEATRGGTGTETKQLDEGGAGEFTSRDNATVFLKLTEGLFSVMTKDAINVARVKSELGEAHLKISDIVAA